MAIPEDTPLYDVLAPAEVQTCSALRIQPELYLHIKERVLSEVPKSRFKKVDTKKWFRIDVNKVGVLYDWFRFLGWIPSDDEWTLP
ncbi:Homeodomain-like protein [Blyttiomyces helicus]|uniref:Homeodomain-like protein n=1 Tax=Blyttiomyces helicus TaxID=388810 RepID=A0A4V1IQE7_9FUNG|nr:Homeodomain-like protein [Blyttiomyces helicus]|eukprot:RKO86297.1 Homeodomain-like protein [Blyttiomyces helicus]